jgi:hypothetical protein
VIVTIWSSSSHALEGIERLATDAGLS